MKTVIQRVKSANVKINNSIVGSINEGMLVLIGITHTDTINEINWMCNKISNLRIFDDENGVMNKSILDIKGEVLFISNFTLYGNAKKGFRPNYTYAADVNIAKPLYDQFINTFKEKYKSQIKIAEGVFGEMMEVSLINDGPVTLIVEK